VRPAKRAEGRSPLGAAGEAGASVHTNSKDSASSTDGIRHEKRKHLGKPAYYPMQWRDFTAYQDEFSVVLPAEAADYNAECRRLVDQYKMPLDGPCLRRAATAIADAVRVAAEAEKGRGARPLLAAMKAAEKVARYRSGNQTPAVLCTLAERVQKVAKRLTKVADSMKTDPTIARTIAARAWEYAEAQRVVAEARAKADDAAWRLTQAQKRATLMRACGRLMTIAQCGACEEYAEGTGELVTMHCHARACPCCARYESGKDFHELRDAMKAMPKRDGYEWRMIELTLKRNPRDSRQHTVDALMARIDALFSITKHVWDSYLARQEGTAMYAKVECAGTGHVHAHLLVFAPFIPKAKLEALVRQVKNLPSGIDHGFVWIELAKKDEEALAAEATKYVTKSHSPMAEDWLAGSPREVMHPTLAARWEIATMGRALSRMYGELRADRNEEKKEEDEREEETERAELPDYCKHCGVVDEMRMVTVPTKETVQAMHAKGMRALRKSKWTPKLKPKPPPLLVEMQGKHHGDVVVLTLRDFREPWRESEYTVASRAEVFGGFFDDVPGIVLPDTLAMLTQSAADGATWALSIERRQRVRARLEQVVFDAAA